MLVQRSPHDYAGQRILVTGATGLIGRELVKRLVRAGARVRTTSTHSPTDRFEGSDLHLVGDLLDRSFAEEATAGVEGLFHCAGRRGSIGIQTTRATTMLANNLLIDFNVLEAARRQGVGRVVYLSTVSVYPPVPLYQEDLAWSANPHPGDQFAAWAKRMGEKLIEAHGVQYGLANAAIVRPVNTFGPHDSFHAPTALVIPALIKRVMDGQNPLVVWGDGSAVRDFLYVEDLAEGLLLAYEKGIGQGPINLGTGRGFSIREVVDAIVKASGLKPVLQWDTSKPTGEARKVADITRARRILGFEPKVPLADGIAATIAWYRQNGARLREPAA
jgi:GDP-L-fucose synthase